MLNKPEKQQKDMFSGDNFKSSPFRVLWCHREFQRLLTKCFELSLVLIEITYRMN